jgi:hypothetical protein
MIPSKLIFSAISLVCLSALVLPAHAALIPVTAQEVDLTASSLVTAYDHTANGPSAGGVLTVDGTIDGCTINGAATTGCSGTGGQYKDSDLGIDQGVLISYDLDAIFDSSGGFVSGTLGVQLIQGTVLGSLGSDPDILLTADLTEFGFAGEGASGFMDFNFTITGGIWGSEGYGTSGGLILTLSSLSPEILDGFNPGVWTQANLLDDGDWATSGSGNFSNNFTDNNIAAPVPVPAAIWLFGSGLMGLLGISRRRKV